METSKPNRNSAPPKHDVLGKRPVRAVCPLCGFSFPSTESETYRIYCPSCGSFCETAVEKPNLHASQQTTVEQKPHLPVPEQPASPLFPRKPLWSASLLTAATLLQWLLIVHVLTGTLGIVGRLLQTSPAPETITAAIAPAESILQDSSATPEPAVLHSEENEPPAAAPLTDSTPPTPIAVIPTMEPAIISFPEKASPTPSMTVIRSPWEEMESFAPVPLSPRNHEETETIVFSDSHAEKKHPEVLASPVAVPPPTENFHTQSPFTSALQPHRPSTKTTDLSDQQSEQHPQPATEMTTQSDYRIKFQLAGSLMEEAAVIVDKDPARALILMINAIKRYQQIGQNVPRSASWLLGRALAAQCWGESLAETLPAVETMTVSKDGCWLLTGCADGTVRIWDLLRYYQHSEGYVLDHSEEPFVKLLFTPDLCWAVGATRSGRIILWNTAQANPSQHRIEIDERLEGLRGMEITPDGRWLIAYGGSREGRASTTQTTYTDLANASQAAAIQSVQAPSSARQYWQAMEPNVLRIWEINRLLCGVQEATTLRGHEKPVRSVTISNDSRWLATAGEDGTARVYDLHTEPLGLKQHVLKGHRDEVTSVSIAPDNRWIATGCRDGLIRVWKMTENKELLDGPLLLDGHLGWVSALSVSPNGRFLASAGYDKTVRLWDMSSLEKPGPVVVDSQAIPSEQGALRDVRFSKDGNILVTQGVDSCLRLWDFSTGSIAETSVLIRDRNMAVSDYLLTGNNRWLVLAYAHTADTRNNGVRLWPLQFENTYAFATDYVQAFFAPETTAPETQQTKADERSVWR